VKQITDELIIRARSSIPMAKKKAVRKASTKKARPGKGTAKAASPKKTKPASKSVAPRPVAPKRAVKAVKKKPSPIPPPAPSLGRPLVTVEEKLYMLFKEDYPARQIFEFLRINTVGELEQYSPQQIIQILTSPVRKTVERIRQKLAENKRHLRDDTEFAREHSTARTD
jgi:hypothetical protein